MIDTLGPYKILDRIGAGGLGDVYRARDTRHGRTVAIKVLPASITGDAGQRERFLRDARLTTVLSHPNIATLYEVSDDQGQLFLVFDFVPGQTLKAIIGGHPLNPRRAIDLTAQAADALAEAHAAGIIHRDLKPDNIIVTPRGNAKLLDYGLSAWTTGGAERGGSAHAADTASTTTPYLSPEQVLGDQGDDRTDVFSLGVMLFEMLTGRLPFTGPTRAALELQIVQAPAPAPSAINPSLPPELDAIVAKALAKSLDQRFASAATFAAELRSVAAMLDVRGAANERLAMPVAVRRARWSATPWIVLGLTVALVALAAAAWVMRVR
jgi:serine/threonine-protein kinase